MSRSQPSLTNPASHLYEWNGGNGTISYYDKEKGGNVTVKLPLELLVLDQLNGVTGWSDRDNIGIWSNETRSTKDDFTVRAGKRVLYVGPYKVDGISQVAGFGGKYCKIVYFAIKNEAGDFILNRFKFTGAALNAWIEFCQHYKVENGKVTITGSTDGKKGATTFKIPTFEYSSATPEEDAEAVTLDKALQNYLREVLNAPKYDDTDTSLHVDEIDDSETLATPEQIADFEKRKADKFEDREVRETVSEVFGDDPGFSDDDIPPEFR